MLSLEEALRIIIDTATYVAMERGGAEAERILDAVAVINQHKIKPSA